MSRKLVWIGGALAVLAGGAVIFFAPVTSRNTEKVTIETVSPLARTWSEFKIRIEDFRQSLRRADALDEENRNLRAENVRLQTEIRQVDYLRI